MKSLLKKFLIFLAVIGSLSLTVSIINTDGAHAVPQTQYDRMDGEGGNPPEEEEEEETWSPPATTGVDGVGCRYFLGMVSWDCGFSGSVTNEEELKDGIWTIVANVASDISVIAAYLVLGYVIYGGYLYTFSAGDPGKVANGKKTLAQAFIGLAIVMSAYIILSALRIALLGDKIFNCDVLRGTDCVTDANQVVTGAINWFIAIAGIASAIFLVYGGIQYITSTGDPGKVQKAKQMITYSLIGLAIVALSFSITAFVSSMVRNSQKDAYINQNIISKEVNENKIN